MNTLVGIILVLIALVLFAVAAATIWWMLHAWRIEGQPRGHRLQREPAAAAHRFTLLVPGRHEEDVMGRDARPPRRAGPPELRDHRDRRPRRPRHGPCRP